MITEITVTDAATTKLLRTASQEALVGDQQW